MKIDWDDIYGARGLFSGYGSRGQCADIKRAAIREVISEVNPQSMLDIGCGDLHVINEVDLSGINYTGIDNSKVLIDGLQESANGKHLICKDFFDLDDSSSYDLVQCLDVLIHVEDLIEYRSWTERLKRFANRGLLISGFAKSDPSYTSSSTVHFHESILETFADYETKVLGEYRGTTLVFVRLDKKRNRKHKLWSYWETPENGTRPAYLDLCEETWHRHCGDDFEIIRVTPETVESYVPDLIPEWHQIPCLAHKADYLRAVLVQRYGGIWLDSDIIVLKNLRIMMDRLADSKSDFIGCGRPGNRPSNGIFGGTPGSKLLERYVEAMNDFIKSRKSDLKFKWTEIGYGLLWPITKNYDYFQYDFRVCIPVHPSRFRKLFEHVRVDELSAADCDLRSDTLTVYLYNAMFPKWFKEMPQNKVLRSPMVIGQLFRKALGISQEDEIIGDDDLFREMQTLKHRNEIPELLQRAGLNGNVCEIGVRTGNNLNVIVQGANPSEFVAIDPWMENSENLSQNDAGISHKTLCELETKVRKRFSKYGNRGKIIKGLSHEVVNQFPDEYFDYVYIDADHSYEAVKKDIKDWFPKVKPGGVLAGHDYLERSTNRVTYGVVQAVNEFVEQKGLKQFATTSEQFASWMILKPSLQTTPTFCYWTVGFQNPKYHAFLRSLVRSARENGVTDDIHVWVDPGVEIEDCIVHEFDREQHLAPRYMFKLEVLKAVLKLDYDYYIYLDADNYFVKKPRPETINRILQLAEPLHVAQDSHINAGRFTPEQMHELKWWGVSLREIVDAYHAKGLNGKKFYLNNAGCFVVERTRAQEIYDTCWEGFRYFYDQLGHKGVTEEIALSYAMAKLTNPEGHRITHKHISDFWCTDRGNFPGQLPDAKPFKLWTNWDGVKFDVQPAIVHAMKSKLQLIEYGNEQMNLPT